jgi:SAM-dependent methyltransferase
MSKTSLRRCPICRCSVGELLHTQRFVLPEGHPLANGYDVLCCEGCGFVFADTAVSQAEYDAFYRNCSKYQDGPTSTGGGASRWDLQRLRETAATVAEVIGDRDARILDVGCANGGLLGALQEMGFRRLTGLDPSPVCAANTRRHAGIHGAAGSLSNLPPDFGSFDCIILSHVLEHVHDLRAAIGVVRQLLARQGWVYLEVPDAMRYADFLAAPFQDFNTEHINHFSLTCLANLARCAGLTLHQEGTRLIDGPHPVPYPAVYGFFRPRTGPASRLVHETALRSKILEYIAQSRQVMDQIEDRLHPAVTSGEQLIVWGTGQLALKLLAETSLGAARIAAFVDGNPINHGRLLRGQRILAPEQVADLPYPIVIASTLHEGEIVQTIRDRLGLANRLITLADVVPMAGVI